MILNICACFKFNFFYFTSGVHSAVYTEMAPTDSDQSPLLLFTLRPVKQLRSEVVVGAQCGSAVLRGAHVFAPGILASPKCKSQRQRSLKVVCVYNSAAQQFNPLFFLLVRHESWRHSFCLLWLGGEVHPRSHKLPREESVCGKWSRWNGPGPHLLHRWTCQVRRCTLFVSTVDHHVIQNSAQRGRRQLCRHAPGTVISFFRLTACFFF